MTLSDKRNALHPRFTGWFILGVWYFRVDSWESVLGSWLLGVVLTSDNHASLEFLDLPEFPSAGLVYVLFSIGYLSFPLNSYFN